MNRLDTGGLERRPIHQRAKQVDIVARRSPAAQKHDVSGGQDKMRQAGRNLREIAPGLATLLVLEEDAAS